MLLLKVVGSYLQYELNELAITSGSLIMMPFSLMEALDRVDVKNSDIKNTTLCVVDAC